MASSPPGSPDGVPKRPLSAVIRPPRSTSRMSMSSKQGGGSRASDEDGRTSVKVVVRVRPPLKQSDPGFELIPQRFQRSMVQVTSPTSLAVDAPQGRKLFVFDRVFGEDVNQEDVWDYVYDSVNSFVQGYNVSILAYGQSGAGKSYTMGTSGPEEQNDPRIMGIIPRAAGHLFEKLIGTSSQSRSNSGLRTPTRYSIASMQALHNLHRTNGDKNWQMKATYVEIYNEHLRDLLLPESTPLTERSTVTIREDTKGRILLTGLHQVAINSIEDLLAALNFGSTIRQTDATAINAKSSRSHAVFSLNLIQRKTTASMMSPQEKRMSVPIEAMSGSESYVTVDSKLHFVDLAGSERLKNTGASGERAKEGISINAGLASLGKVIAQLSSRQAGSHVSYRDSKLTRLLQDSLGGNAITYMIACVTPAEFHLSETLNTVQYAQRARAIQSKPRIQQVNDDSDKQAVIERLRAEVSFLREQIRNSERGGRGGNIPQERAERQNEREIELQNHLLDVQESYTALSQRHAKLISEITKAGDSNGETPALNNMIGSSAVERLKRSHSFAESVEAVVLEYEKTIQSLESSLSNTRSTLSNTGSSLLERETKCAYVETVNQQLQSRVQKMIDREANTEHYLHDLEAKLDGHTSGEEKNSAIVTELRKEIARVRENEASCEDYISTLEERLAEADQDVELMQREVDRLEHVVERQRSLGKLDNLLYELDHIQQNGKKLDDEEHLPNVVSSMDEPQHSRARSLDTLHEAAEIAIPESDDEELGDTPPELESDHDGTASDDGLEDLEKAASATPVIHKMTQNALPNHQDYSSQSPAQSKFVADKLEDVTQELFDLRVEHESTVNEYDLLSAKYQQALRTLAELQDAVDEARHPAAVPTVASPADSTSRPASFLEDARINELKCGGHLSSSRSLSSELSLAGESPTSPDPSDISPLAKKPHAARASQDMERMQKLLSEHEEGMNLVTQQYAQLQADHQDTLDLIEELKAEVQKARMGSPTSSTHLQPVIRRMTSQNVMTVDRAHRSLASLRNIAVEEFDGRPDAMQNFEVNLNTAMHELHSRMERIHALEAENKSVKKKMETKATIISGLTRERSSLKGSSPMDISVVSQMRDQLVQSENQIRKLSDSHAAREKTLMDEIQSLNESLGSHKEDSRSRDVASGDQDKKIADLQGELSHWRDRHQTAVNSMQSSEKQLLTTLAELEAAMASVEAMRAEKNQTEDASAEEKEAAANSFDNERTKHQEMVDNLKHDIEDHKATINAHAEMITGLKAAQSATREELDQQLATREASDKELESHRKRISELQQEIEEHKSAVEFHKHGLKSLHDSHAREIEEMRLSSTDSTEAEIDSRLAEQTSRHEHVINALRTEISRSRNEVTNLIDSASKVLNQPTSVSKLHSQLQEIMNEKSAASQTHAQLTAQKEELERQLESKHGNHAELEKQVAEINGKAAQHEERTRELSDLVAKHEATIQEKDEAVKQRDKTIQAITAEKQKSTRLVDELEEQIANSFDQHHNRLSVIQAERNQALVEANAKIGSLEQDIEKYRTRIEQPEASDRTRIRLDLSTDNNTQAHLKGTPGSQAENPQTRDRSNSLTSNLRKSASVASLPSPPPAIPLPPLPTLPNITITANGPLTNGAANSPPNSRHTSKELATSQLVEDQEARIRTIEKHLHAEKQLTASLEEALVDLEMQSNKVKSDMEGWKKKAWTYEDELSNLRKERNSTRLSVQAVEEERTARREAEAARAHLEERMNAISKKKKKSTLNCF